MDFFFIAVFSFFIIISLSRIAKKISLVDIPDNRKIHKTRIPLIGGISIYTTLILSFFIFDEINLPFYKILFFFSAFIVIIGIVDDLKNISYKFRIILIILTSYLIIFYTDIYIRDLGIFFNFVFENLGLFGILFTLFCVVALVNAFNFIDGVDGLASIQSILILSIILFYDFLFSLNHNLKINIYLMETLVIFIFFNLFLPNKYKIFLGDAGSMFLGFYISWIVIYMSQHYNALPIMLIPWILSYPVFDLVSTVIIRLTKQISPFRPDHFHFHFILLKQKKLNKININIIILILTLIFNLIGFLSYTFLFEELSFIILIISFLIFHYYKWQSLK